MSHVNMSNGSKSASSLLAASWFRRIGFVHSEPQADYVVRARIAACTIALEHELRLRDTYNFSSFSALFGQPPARSRTRRGAAMTAELAACADSGKVKVASIVTPMPDSLIHRARIVRFLQ